MSVLVSDNVLKEGDRIKLVAMPYDPDPVARGTEGVVKQVICFGDKVWQVHVLWDCTPPRSLSLAPIDVVEVLT